MPFMTLALEGSEGTASCPCYFTQRDKAHDILLDRTLGGPRCYGKEISLTPAHPAHNTVNILTRLSRLR